MRTLYQWDPSESSLGNKVHGSLVSNFPNNDIGEEAHLIRIKDDQPRNHQIWPNFIKDDQQKLKMNN